MANGLIGGFGSFGRGQTQGQSQGSLLGNVFQEQPTAGQLRRGLFNEVVQQYGGNAQQTAGAAIGAGLGIGISKLLGRDVEGAERANKIRRVQERVSREQAENFATNPSQAFTRTAELLFDEGLQAEGIAALNQARQFAPEPVETTIRAVGGTDRAKALAERYPDVGQIEEGQEFSITLSDGEFRSVNAGAAPQEEKVAASIREYEQALERGLIDPSTSYPDFLNLGSERSVSSGTGTEADRNLFLTTIDEDEDLKTSVESLMTGDEEGGFLGFGGAPADEESTRLAVAAEAKNISDDAAASGQRISPKQAIRQAVQNLRTTESQTAPQENNEGQQRDQGPASPQNDAYADRLNP